MRRLRVELEGSEKRTNKEWQAVRSDVSKVLASAEETRREAEERVQAASETFKVAVSRSTMSLASKDISKHSPHNPNPQVSPSTARGTARRFYTRPLFSFHCVHSMAGMVTFIQPPPPPLSYFAQYFT